MGKGGRGGEGATREELSWKFLILQTEGILCMFSDSFLEDSRAGGFLRECSTRVLCGKEIIYVPNKPQLSSVVIFDEQD